MWLIEGREPLTFQDGEQVLFVREELDGHRRVLLLPVLKKNDKLYTHGQVCIEAELKVGRGTTKPVFVKIFSAKMSKKLGLQHEFGLVSSWECTYLNSIGGEQDFLYQT